MMPLCEQSSPGFAFALTACPICGTESVYSFSTFFAFGNPIAVVQAPLGRPLFLQNAASEVSS